MFLLRQHFRTIPTDLDDAARIDGAGHLTIIRHIMVPLSWPAISAVMVITGQYIWNDFFWPNLFINSTSRMTAPLALYNLESRGRAAARSGRVFAGLSVLCVPVRDRVRVPAAPPDGGHRLPRHLAVRGAFVVADQAESWPVARSYTGADLHRISLPLGGIGTGTVGFGGRGQFRDWELENHPSKGLTSRR